MNTRDLRTSKNKNKRLYHQFDTNKIQPDHIFIKLDKGDALMGLL